MRLGIVQMSGIATALAVVVTVGYWGPSVAARAYREIQIMASQPEPQASAVTLAADVPTPPPVRRRVNDRGIQADLSDPDVAHFLEVSVRCNNVMEVSMRDFLHMRMAQGRSVGIAQTYKIRSDSSYEKPVVLVDETVRLASGRALAGIPLTTTFSYLVDWPRFYLWRVEPQSPSQDPLGFLREHWVAACNGSARRLH